MRFLKFAIIVAAAANLAACATRGSITVDCNGFDSYRHPLPPSRLIQEIQSDAVTKINLAPRTLDFEMTGIELPASATSDPMAKAMADLIIANADNRRPGPLGILPAPKPRAVLLLSGGGQWGAFGAGFLNRLNELGGDRHIDFGVITGVSTGGLQSMFVAIDDPAAYEGLIRAYSPRQESDIVNRTKWKPLAVVTGSLAGLKPLRKKIEAALCTAGDPSQGCPLVDALARSGRTVYIGFVKASSGEFVYVDATIIAQAGSGVDATTASRRNAQQCLTGVALASAAMPVFFQRVQIGRPGHYETYYDGGVRQSVFEVSTGEQIERGIAVALARTPQSERKNLASPDLYVIRNGPTQLLGPRGTPDADFAPDRKADALTAAFRAEAIVVNQLEVGSIAALRLAHPRGTIRLATADGYHKWLTPPGQLDPAGCTKPADVMFDRDFMLCLQRFGRHKAERNAPASPWIELGELPPLAKGTK